MFGGQTPNNVFRPPVPLRPPVPHISSNGNIVLPPSMNSNSAKIKDIATYAALTGITGYIAESAFGTGGTMKLPLVGTVSAATGVGLTCAASAIVTETTKQYIAPMIGGVVGPMAVQVTAPLITGAANAGILYYTGNSGGLLNDGLIGAGACVGGTYAARTLLGMY